MLTLEETRWSLVVFKNLTSLNILPIQVDVQNGKIRRQSSKIRIFMWKLLFGFGLAHLLYVFARLVQSTVVEPEKLFRWDHFVLHSGQAFCYAVFYLTGFRLFGTNAEENVIVFNQLFIVRENPVQKMIQEKLQMRKKWESGNGIGKPGNQKRAKSGAQPTSTSAAARKPREESEMVVIENQPESDSGCVRPLLTWPPQYSLDELLAKMLPMTVGFTAVFFVLFLAVDPTRPQLLYSVLPPEWQNVWIFLSLTVVETLCLTIAIFTGTFSIVTQVLFFSKCQLEFNRMNLQLRNLEDKFQNCSVGSGAVNDVRDIRREIWILRQILLEMRKLACFIELFNRCFPFLIFAWKIFSLSSCIMFYFFVIRHHGHFPLLACFSGYCAMAVTMIYAIMYANAFSIPGKMDELKNEFLLTAQKTTSTASNANEAKTLNAEMKKEIKGIRGVGIKVGSFHQMERESTPNFIDFVINQVVDLLVTFPR